LPTFLQLDVSDYTWVKNILGSKCDLLTFVGISLL